MVPCMAIGMAGAGIERVARRCEGPRHRTDDGISVWRARAITLGVLHGSVEPDLTVRSRGVSAPGSSLRRASTALVSLSAVRGRERACSSPVLSGGNRVAAEFAKLHDRVSLNFSVTRGQFAGGQLVQVSATTAEREPLLLRAVTRSGRDSRSSPGPRVAYCARGPSCRRRQVQRRERPGQSARPGEMSIGVRPRPALTSPRAAAVPLRSRDFRSPGHGSAKAARPECGS